LNDLEARIAAAGNGVQPIAHFAWQQTASAWGSRAGFTVERLAGNVPGLSGRIFLERGQYLHLGMSLNYTQGGVIALVTPVKKGPPGR
jgi:hypothetical protein